MSGMTWKWRKNWFPEIASNLGDIGDDFEEDAAGYFRDKVLEQLYPGHGVDTGYMKSNIERNGNRVTSSAYYTGYVNSGTHRFPGYHFWEQAQEDTTHWMPGELMHRIGKNLL